MAIKEEPQDLLESIHRVLYPEQWSDCKPELLNGEGLYEWSPDDLEVIGYIIGRSVELGYIKPDREEG